MGSCHPCGELVAMFYPADPITWVVGPQSLERKYSKMTKNITRGTAGIAALALMATLSPATAAAAGSSTTDPTQLVEDGGYEYYEPGSAHGSSIGSSPITGALVILGVVAAGNFLVNEVPEIRSAIDSIQLSSPLMSS